MPMIRQKMKMSPIVGKVKEYAMLEKIKPSKDLEPLKKISDYGDDFDNELSKVEDAAKMRGKGVITENERKIMEGANRRSTSRSMMRTSSPEIRETKQQMIRRKAKDLGIVGQLTENEVASIKRSMTARERKMLDK